MDKVCPLAVMAPKLGVRSETFIYRHMTGLMPGKTAIFAHAREQPDTSLYFPSPQCILGAPRRDLQWLYQVGRYFLGLDSLTPVKSTVRRELVRWSVEAILCEYLDYSLKWLDVARMLGIRFYAHAHGYDVSIALRDPVMRQRYLQLESAEGIIVVSEYSKYKLVELGLSAEKIHVIPCGIDVCDTLPQRMVKENILCVAVGRMVEKKAPLLALEAFRRASEVCPQLRLDYVGDGELFDQAKNFLVHHNLNHKVRLLGDMPNEKVHRLMSESNIFLQHSMVASKTGDEEGLPVSILEAMSHGLPVVSTKHAGIPEAVLHNVTGLLVEEGDVESMAQYIVTLANDREYAGELGAAGWKRVRNIYSWGKERSELLKLMGFSADI